MSDEKPQRDKVALLLYAGAFAVLMLFVALLADVPEFGLLLVPLALLLAVLAWRRGQHGAAATGGDLTGRVAELEERLGELELNQERLIELEERLDFTERLLAQARDPARIGREEHR